MKILITGAGALGGYFGGVLARGGLDVTFLERNRHLELINRDGLKVESVSDGDFTVHAPAVEQVDGSWQADLVLFCVKAYHNERAIEAISKAIGDDTTVLTLQNGIGSGDQLAGAFGREKVLLGVAYYEGQRKAPGVIAELGGERRIVFGEEDGRQSERVIGVHNLLRQAGVDAHISPNVLRDLWNKLIMICALAGMTCITRGSFAEVINTPATRDMAGEVMREAAAVGKAKGVDLAGDVVETTMAYFQQYKNELVSSMYFDLEAGRPLELGGLNGAVSRFGRELDVATPVNDFITTSLSVADNRARSSGI